MCECQGPGSKSKIHTFILLFAIYFTFRRNYYFCLCFFFYMSRTLLHHVYAHAHIHIWVTFHAAAVAGAIRSPNVQI